jgi:hypothetical protein
MNGPTTHRNADQQRGAKRRVLLPFTRSDFKQKLEYLLPAL